MRSRSRSGPTRILVVGHEATASGASLQLLHLLNQWSGRPDLVVEVVLRRGGVLLPDYRALSEVSVLTPRWISRLARIGPLRRRMLGPRPPADSKAAPPSALGRSPGQLLGILKGPLLDLPMLRLRRLVRRVNPDIVYLNTGLHGDLLSAFRGRPIVTYLHEQDVLLRRTTFSRHVARLLRRSDVLLASSAAVRDDLAKGRGLAPERVHVVHPFVPPQIAGHDRESAVAKLRGLCGLGPDGVVVGGCGPLSWEKDPDCFVEVARLVRERLGPGRVGFVWLGGADDDHARVYLQARVATYGLDGTVRFLPARPDAGAFFAGLDVFALVSRTESFGVVALEAARESVPIVCFEAPGGAREFVRDDAGFVVPGRDVATLAERVIDLVLDPELRQRLGRTGAARVARAHDVADSAERVLQLMFSAAPGVLLEDHSRAAEVS